VPTRKLPLDPQTRALLDALIAMSSDLDLRATLHRITRSACEVTRAGYGALVTVGDGEVTYGVAPAGEPGARPGGRAALRVPVHAGGSVFGDLYLTGKYADGPAGQGSADFTDLDENLVWILAGAAGQVIDNARAYAASERRRRWLEAEEELTGALDPPLNHETALRRICESVSRLTAARAVAVVTHEGHGPVAALAATPAEEELALRGALAQTLMPPGTTGPEPPHAEGLHVLAVPFWPVLAGRGSICVLYDDTSDLAHDEEGLLARFAAQAALTLDRVHAIEAHADLAAASDRERIARELHDVVIQRVFATGLQLQALGTIATDPAAQERLAAAVDALDLTIRDIRTTVFELQHPGGETPAATI